VVFYGLIYDLLFLRKEKKLIWRNACCFENAYSHKP
jgi:hypothetical protein